MKNIVGAVLLMALAFVAEGQTPGNSDKIKITNLYTAAPVTRGVENEFTVEVAYTFESTDEAEIGLGFNTDKPGAFKMIEHRIVKRGSDTVTFKVNVIPVDWGEKGRFSVLVNISKSPHEVPWKPSASDRKEIPVGQ
jgi:hypothetical protein